MTVTTEATWVAVCAVTAVPVASGVAALLDGRTQVAVFRSAAGHLYALSNMDPFSGACVLARGIVGDRAGVPVVASPMHKQSFDLRTGGCLDDPNVSVPVYQVRVVDGAVQVRSP